jgi:hypothetical protein
MIQLNHSISPAIAEYIGKLHIRVSHQRSRHRDENRVVLRPRLSEWVSNFFAKWSPFK